MPHPKMLKAHMQIARGLVKRALRNAGKKIAHYKATEINNAARALWQDPKFRAEIKLIRAYFNPR